MPKQQYLEAEVEGLGQVLRVAKPFDEATLTLKEQGASVISAKGLAYARNQTGIQSTFSQKGSYVREGLVYVPDKTLIIRNSPFLARTRAQKAVESHKNGNEFYIGEKFAEKYIEQAEEDKNKKPAGRRVLVVNKRGQFEIPVDSLDQEELGLFLFGEQAEKYKQLLKEQEINRIPIYFSSNSNKYFINQLWLSGLGSRSSLNGDYRDLDYDNGVRGVRGETAEGGSKNVPKEYSPAQVREALRQTLKRANLTGLEKQIIEPTINFLGKI